MKRKKLVLFDIDGTLIRPLKPQKSLERFPYAIGKVFNVTMTVRSEDWPYNGVGDRAILWDMVKDKGISRAALLHNLPKLARHFYDYLSMVARDGPVYEQVADAKKLLDMVVQSSHLSYGVLTGNLIDSARWKLAHTGYGSPFTFGAYGHETDTREALAKRAVAKVKKHFGRSFRPRDVIVIGDTHNDIRCGKAIGAVTVVVVNSWNVDRLTLEREHPDLLVDSLMDERVLSLLGLDK